MVPGSLAAQFELSTWIITGKSARKWKESQYQRTARKKEERKKRLLELWEWV